MMRGKKQLLLCLSALFACGQIADAMVPAQAKADIRLSANETRGGGVYSDSYQSIREYWKSELLGDMRGLESDQDLAKCIQMLDDKAKGYLNTMLDPSTSEHLWNDTAYMNAETGAKVTESLDRLKLITIQIYEPASSLYQDQNALNQVKQALRFVLDKKYGPDTPKGSSNWWDWEIGAPKAMVDIAILLYDVLDEKTITDVTKTIDRFVPKADYRLNSSLKETGANLCDKVAIVIKRAALDNNEERLAHAKNCMSPLFGYSNSGDGYYPDGSFIQHGNIPYNGSYGYVLLDELTNCIIMLSLSDYAIDSEDIAFYENTLLNHYIPFLSYGGNMVDSVRGRAVSRKVQQGDTMGMQTMGVLLQYADVAATADTKQEIYKQLKGIVDSKFDQVQTEDFSMLRYADYMRVKSLAQNDAFTAMNRNSFKVYSFMDRIVANRIGYTFTLAANSSRMCTEYGNSENLLGRYQGQGYTQIYTDDINQYNEDYNATVDQKRLAGVTTAHQELGFTTAGQSKWSGGSTLDGINGVSGFELTGEKNLTKLAGGFGSETATGVKSGVTAKKSYFVFGNKIVYLGSGINNLNYDPDIDTIESIVENRKMFNGMKLRVDGNDVATSNGSQTVSNAKSAYLTGKTANSGIGYVFLEENTDIQVKRETRNATWADVNKIAKFTNTDPVSNDFISMSVDHGKTPSNDTYAWIVMPNVNQSEVSGYIAAPTITVLDNNATVQAVYDAESKQSAYNFFIAGSTTDGNVSVNAPVSMVMEETAEGYRLAVSDPTRSQSAVQITIKGFTNLNHVGITGGDAQVISTDSDSMTIQVDFTSKDGQSRLVEIGTTFETKTANLALNKTATASSVVQNTATQQRLAKFAVDGDAATRWASNYERTNSPISTEEADTGWFVVDLGEELTFNQVKISWEFSLSNDYDIQISNDNSTWTTVASVKENTGYKGEERKDDVTFDEVTARYVRMQSKSGSRPRQAGVSDPAQAVAGGLSIYEFEVYNSVDLAKSVARGEQLLKDYPDSSAFATSAQYETLKKNLEDQIQAAKTFMAEGANYQEDKLREVAAKLDQACREFDKAVLHVTSIKIDDPMTEALDKGETKALTFTINPSNAYNKNVEWSTSNRNIVRVDENGVITGVTSGKAVITVTSKDNGLSDSVEVTVMVKPKTITLDQPNIEMKKGESTKLNASVSPVDAASSPLKYVSGNTNVVTVDSTGTITAVGVGESDITVSSTLNPNVKAIAHVVVKANLVVSSDNLMIGSGGIATASSTVSNNAVKPEYAIDGDFETRWASLYNGVTAEEAEGAWWMVELPNAITFNHIDITWFSENVYGKEYKIMVSDDGTNWQEAYHETNGKNKTYGFDFEAVSGKFIKFQGIKRTATNGGYGIVEFEVYYRMDYDKIITQAKQMINQYPSTLAEYTQLKQAVANAESLLETKPNFEEAELRAVLTAVSDAMSAYEAKIIHVSGIQGNEMAMNGGEQALLSYVITPSDAFNQEVTIVNDNPDIVTVDENNMVTALKRGTAVVHVTTIDGGFTSDVVIHVTSNYAPVINASDISIILDSTFDPLDYASATDVEDGEIVLTMDNVVKNTVDTSKLGSGIVTYRVSDSDGNTTEKTITVSVIRDEAWESAKQKLTITLATAKTLRASDYTAESYRILAEAIEQGDAIVNVESATAKELNDAYETLLAAIKALKPFHEGVSGEDYVTTITEENADVSIIGKFPVDTELVVEVLDETILEQVMDMIKDHQVMKKYNVERIFDIYMLRNSAIYRVGSTFTIRIKLEEEWVGKHPKIIYIADNGEVSEIASDIKDGYISFQTNHNSYYAIVTDKNPITDTAVPTGNSDGNGIIAIVLSVGMLAYFAKKRSDVLKNEMN